MNAELVADGQKRIIIPTVYREDYLLNLKAATKRRGFGGFLTMAFDSPLGLLIILMLLKTSVDLAMHQSEREKFQGIY